MAIVNNLISTAAPHTGVFTKSVAET